MEARRERSYPLHLFLGYDLPQLGRLLVRALPLLGRRRVAVEPQLARQRLVRPQPCGSARKLGTLDFEPRASLTLRTWSFDFTPVFWLYAGTRGFLFYL